MNKVLRFATAFIRTKRRLIEKNIYPDYKLSVSQINEAIKTLKKYFGEKAQKCIVIKETPKQQWNIHNPNLKAQYFDKINCVNKAFWLGLLSADGYIRYDEIA